MAAQEQLPANFAALAQRVFREDDGKLYIGQEEIDDTLRSVLRDEATYILNSRLWEILNATISNEAARLALIQSQNWDHILTAKQLHHWGHVFRTIITRLARP